MKKIIKEDFKAIYWIEHMNYNDPNLLSGEMNITEEEATNKLIDLEKRGLIVIEYREGKIYGSQLTKEGKEIFNGKKYMKWKLELGY